MNSEVRELDGATLEAVTGGMDCAKAQAEARSLEAVGLFLGACGATAQGAVKIAEGAGLVRGACGL
ncbi:hypothetical protein JQ604_35955 [Bradyrhizobium jicamae]|uniref:hypothetical protein n=1 Tax=Bradyrhizobium jicamae TaxID=280332 RepID=UPI001BADBCA7|nr:hypothetical protein [Bradyrhizobium jicamae]MBR0757604.1 hypothetical protein [Bradyrhizobium jicamae]